MQKAKWIAIGVAAGLLLILILQNTEPVETRILFTSFVMPRAVLLFATAALGFICGGVLALLLFRRGR